MIDTVEVNVIGNRSASITVKAPPPWSFRGVAFRCAVAVWRLAIMAMARYGVPTTGQ